MLAFHQLTSICVEVPVCEDMCVSTFLPLGTADGKVSAPVAQTVKRLPTVWEARQSLGLEDPLEKEMATHSSTLAWKIPRTEERGRLRSMGSQRVGHD